MTTMRTESQNTTATPVVLVRPPMCFSRSTYSSPVTPPLALALLAASLEQRGHSVVCIDGVGEAPDKLRIHEELDCYLRGISLEEVVAKIPAGTRFIGVSCMFSQEWLVTRELLYMIRAAHPQAKIVIGGEHATALPEFILETCPAVDACALGEGDGVIIDLVEKFAENPEEVAGIVYRGPDGKPVKSSKRPRLVDLNNMPLPSWHTVPIRNYHAFGACNGIYAGVSMPMLATRGCPFQCTFCSNPTMWGNRYYMRPAAQVIDEIEGYVRDYGATAIEFYDLTAIIKKEWIMEFVKIYKERGLSFSWTLPSGTRSEALDAEVLKGLADTNCKYLVYAAESGSAATLKAIKKKITLDKMLASIREAKKNELTLRCNLMLGLPSEKRIDVWKTVFFQWKLAFTGVDDVPLYMFSPYPGSELFRELLADGMLGNLDDNYFKSLLQQIDLKRSRSYNKNVSGRELAFYRLIGMGVAYMLTYLCFPRRMWRTFRNVFIDKKSETVFEQRVIELKRIKAAAKEAESTKEAPRKSAGGAS